MSSNLPVVSTVGLTEVFSSPSPQIDIVFVHGLNGNPYNTWTAENNVFWPRDLLPNHVGEVQCRVLTYGYDARVSAFTDGVGNDHIHHHAENLAARLYSNRSSNNAITRPLIFVVHSLGGLVTKQCLIYSRSLDHPNSEHLRSIYVSTYGILFMGTPHLGSDLAKWGTLLQSIASAVLPRKLFDSSSHLVEALKTNNETLQNINRQFNEILPRLRIYFFYEGKPMDMKGTRQFVVDEASAAPDFPGVERMVIERDHSHMCKFDNAQSPGFTDVAEAIRRYSNEAPDRIAVRWDRERYIRAIEREASALELLPPDPNKSSRGTSPDSRWADSRNAPTPLLSSQARTPVLLENGPTTLRPYEVEEHDGDASRKPSSTRLPFQSLADSTNLTSPPIPSSPSASVPKLNRPMVVAPLGFRPNTHFVGFDIEMARLETKLADEQRRDIGACAALLYGPPGCGKSHLARQYLWQHVTEYPNGIFWIDCKTPESLNKGFWNVSQSLGCFDELSSTRTDAFIDAVRSHLAQKDRWLMVFDGIKFATEQDLENFKRYVPDGRGSSIIYTTVDRTLSHRQRLLNPPGIKVYPLTTDQACSLLFKSLQMRDDRPPTAVQLRKAKQLVKQYACLPLGIHAAAHALIARGRPLEKYAAGPSDLRLSSPFLTILEALSATSQVEAVNLLLIICFLNHEIPIAMLQFGHRALVDAGVEIRSLEQGGSTRRELDLSIATLIKNGLIERRLQTFSSSPNGGRSSPEETRTTADRHHSVPSIEQNTREDGDSQNSSPAVIGIDIIRVHDVVQQVYLDYLRSRSSSEFNAWLHITTKFIIGSWNNCFDKIRARSGRGLVADYREFENHVEKVWSHFPARSDGVSQELRKAHHDLHAVRRLIKREIENQSPSQSSSTGGRPHVISIFERSGSSSDEGPATPLSDLTRKSTWSNDPIAPSSESPIDAQMPFSNLALEDSWYSDAGYLSDNEDRLKKERTTSSSTEKATEGRQLALRAFLGGRGRADGDAYRAMPVIGPVSVADIEPVHSRSNSASSQHPLRPGSTTSLAEAALSAVHKMSPPSSKEGSRASSARNERRPLSELSSNTQVTQQSSDAPLSRPPSSPRLVQTALENTIRRGQLPIEENISIMRRSKPMQIFGKPFIPTLSTLESHSLPAEYGPVPMARDLSHESTTSVQTEPAENNNSNSTDGSFLTPITSPVEAPASFSSSRRRPASITTTSAASLPYPVLDSPDTEPLPILTPRTAFRDGLGIVKAPEPKGNDQDMSRS